MKSRADLVEFIMTFFVITACISILQGVLGMIFLPEVKLGYEACFVPCVFGFLSAVMGLFTTPGKEAGVKAVLIGRAVHLLLIEGLVFGVNYAVGAALEARFCLALAVSIAVVFVVVHLALWANEWRSAEVFNRRLKEYQEGGGI